MTSERSVADYSLMLIQCLLGIIAIIIPKLITRRGRIEVPSTIYIMYLIFLYCAIFLGEVTSFYYLVPNWDTILHTFSGMMLGALGFSFINILNNDERLHLNLSPVFVSLFAFCFAVTLGALWEIYEFSFDGILNLNMQKFAVDDGTQLIGREALIDTMKDIIVDCVGAFSMSLLGYIDIKSKKGKLDKYLIKIKNKEA